MNPRSLLSLLAGSLALFLVCEAQAQPSDEVYPKTSFDAAAVAAQMQPGGPATLRGKIVRTRGRLIFKRKEQAAPRGAVVVIWPYTPYFEEFLALRKKHEDGRKRVVFTADAYSYRIVARITGDDGEFEVSGIRPGRYYVEYTLHYTASNVRDVPVGTETVYSNKGIVGQHTVYAQERYYYPASKLSSAVITIKPGDTLVEAQID
jgi:hypothetical protein